MAKDFFTHNPLLNFLANLTRTVTTRAAKAFGRHSFNPNQFKIEQHEITLAALAPAFDGYRIVQISDIHMGTWMNAERLSGLVTLVNQLSADTLVFTGDFLTHDLPGIVESMEPIFSRFKAKDAKLAVLGNHDYWSNPKKVRSLLRNTLITNLSNRIYPINRGTDTLIFAGLDDYYNGHADLDAVLAQLPCPPDSPVILLVHVADFADIAAETGRFDLQLSGHTHGGQIVLPLIGAPILPPLGKKYRSGWYKIKNMLHYTTRGVGTSSIPVRFNCPAEITVITLRSLQKEVSLDE